MVSQGSVLVTGGAGFIGHHLVRELVKRNYRITVLDNLSTGKKERIVDFDSPLVDFIEGDIRDSGIYASVFKREFRTVFHLAAQSNVPDSLTCPSETEAINVGGSRHLAETCLAQNTIPYLVFASSAAVYGSKVSAPTREDALCEPESPYGESKLQFEKDLAGRWGERAHYPRWAGLRFSNVFGSGQSINGEPGVITRFMYNVDKGLPLLVFGSGHQTRDFIHVRDIVGALLHASTTLSTKKSLNGVYNVSTQIPTSINDLVTLIGAGSRTPLTPEYRPSRPGDVLHSSLDNSRLRATGWHPTTNLERDLTVLLRYAA